jgi:hypothetical protein
VRRDPLTEHLLTYNYRPAKGKSKNMLFNVLMLEPLLQMAADFSRQYAYLPKGSYAPDGRDPHSARLNRQLPLKARAQPAKFTQHGVTVRELLSWAGVDVDDIDIKDRTWWKKNLPKKLDSLPVLDSWQWKSPPSKKWDIWREGRVLLQVKRPINSIGEPEVELETGPPKMAAGWFAAG